MLTIVENIAYAPQNRVQNAFLQSPTLISVKQNAILIVCGICYTVFMS